MTIIPVDPGGGNDRLRVGGSSLIIADSVRQRPRGEIPEFG
jgi:hypothetical protein